MAIDNFSFLANHIGFQKEDNMFVMIQIVRRQKDHPNEKVKEGSLATYFVRSKQHLLSLEDEIKNLCLLYGARAYINISPKSIQKLQGLVAQELVRKMNDNEVDNPIHVTKSVAGKMKSKTPWWVIDMDEDKLQYKSGVLRFLSENKIVFKIIKTVSGYHYLTRPFNRKEFSDKFPEIDLHVNSMGALLYFPFGAKINY